MDWLSVFWYGLIQGLTEFIPVSSSGHLALLPHFLEIKDPGVFFDLMMHLGTAIAVIVYFRRRIWRCLRVFHLSLCFWKKSDHFDVHYGRNFMISTFATVILILLIKDTAEQFGRDPKLIALNLFVFGLLLFLSDWRGRKKTIGLFSMEKKLQPWRSIAIGLSQALAIFPGVSRSGITMTAGMATGLDRLEASSYSFLLSLPIIIAGSLYKLPEFLKGSHESVSIDILLFGVLFSFLIGILTIHYFLKIVTRLGMGWFFLYRAILSLLILTML